MSDLMKITLMPVRMDAELALAREGNSLVINGETVPLMPQRVYADDEDEGAALHPLLVAPMFSESEGWSVTVLVPYPASKAQSPPTPKTIEVKDDGPITLN